MGKAFTDYLVYMGIFFFIVLTVYFFPIEYRLLGYNIDESHKFAANYFFQKHLFFGKDVIFSYGPLAFLMTPMRLGFNQYLSTGLIILLWTVFFSVFCALALKKYFSLFQLAVFVAFLYLSRLFCPSLDYFICFVVLLFLSLSLELKEFRFLYFASLALTFLAFFIKFSSAFMCIAAVLIFLLINFIFDRKRAGVIATQGTIIVLFLSVPAYYFFDFSVKGVYFYMKGIYEIISGYTEAVSLPGSSLELAAVFVSFFLYLLLTILLKKQKQKSFYSCLLLILPLFLAFKHGFVRQDKHVYWFFGFIFMAFSIVFLTTDFKKFIKGDTQKKILLWIVIPVIIITMIGAFLCKRKFEGDKKPPYRRIPPLANILKPVGEDSFSNFSLGLNEQLYYSKNKPFNYKPFPVFHMYSAFTPYLDNLNFQFLNNTDTAPLFILMHFFALNRRNPIADVPATWLSLLKWYKVDSNSSLRSPLLVKRTQEPSFNDLRFLKKKEYNIDELIEIPYSNHPIVAKINMDLSIWGKIRKTFFRITEVTMVLKRSSASEIIFRVVPATLKNGLVINFLPQSFREMANLMNQKAIKQNRTFMISGDGKKYYKKRISIVFFEIPEMVLH